MKKLLLLCLLGIVCLGLMSCDTSAEEDVKSSVVIKEISADLTDVERPLDEEVTEEVVASEERGALIKEKASDVDPKKVAEALGLDEVGQVRYEELKAEGLTAKEIISKMQEEGYDIEVPKGRN
ncbi:hypothetical protein EZV73_07530 [Acidaminobacter sp. JC074]|uniref:hypothetical protein n=1 Tax=Acidaminobacter sp. JC074 TaxID=2530199 RepID=UPI001F0DD202|nr:hypothetical protein [Acidaminobacter sp. JC074]MCH4887416.1 hypothetical protein [Acidaminobacter sp. JC074]